MKIKEVTQQLNEVAMSPGALEKFLRSSAANGIVCGFEAELIFPGFCGSSWRRYASL